jgi:hypothetical protein
MNRGPVAFISSFYTETNVADYHDSPLWRIRRDLHKMGLSDEFSSFHDRNSNREPAWVAEWSERDLAGKQPLEVVDRLVQVLSQSDLYVCILADARRGSKDHGSPIPVADQASATSYFEIELYAAAMYSKPVKLYILEGFSPGPRLTLLLDLLANLFPEWRNQKPLSAPAILKETRQYILRHLEHPDRKKLPLRRRLVGELYRARETNSAFGHELDDVLFLAGQFEPRNLPQKDLVESLISECERVPEMQRKLSRMWLAVRELMSASYLPKDVQSDGRLRDFLPLWDRVLGLWSSAAAWSGWHGHIYAGCVASLHSQTVIRSQLLDANTTFGGLASAYYSIANLMPFGLRRFGCLRRASRYIEEEIGSNQGRNAGDFAVRGSIRLQSGNFWGAVSDFRKMLQIRERSGASDEEWGDAMVHLGFGYLYCGRLWKGREHLIRGVQALSVDPNHPRLARAKRKLALAYSLTGRFREGRLMRSEADAIALRLGALDQFGR